MTKILIGTVLKSQKARYLVFRNEVAAAFLLVIYKSILILIHSLPLINKLLILNTKFLNFPPILFSSFPLPHLSSFSPPFFSTFFILYTVSQQYFLSILPNNVMEIRKALQNTFGKAHKCIRWSNSIFIHILQDLTTHSRNYHL